MVKKRISFDINIPEGYTGKSSKKSARKSLKKKRAQAGSASLHKGAYKQYKEKLVGTISKFFEHELAVIAEWVKDMMDIRRKIRIFLVYLMLLFAGLMLVLIGIAKYIEFICPYLNHGLAYVFVGLAAMALGVIYKKIAR